MVETPPFVLNRMLVDMLLKGPLVEWVNQTRHG
jgi:hypothetical protein